jgi:hypothetical protein
MKATIKWSDGRVDVREIDPTATTLVEFGSDGQNHEFVPTGETDDEGRDVYVELVDADPTSE